MSEPKRLNKFISETGFCSRRDADRFIEQGRVTVNGKVPEMGTKVTEQDEIRVNGKPLKAKPKRVYLAYNKPVGITCTTDSQVKENIVRAVKYQERIFPIGRLDKPSEGLIFLTNEGDIVNKILRAGNNHEKEYVVNVDKPIDQHFIERMAGGIPILDTVTQPCKVHKLSDRSFNIVLTQGLNRQIRRMCEYLGYEVTKLKRIRIMNVELGNLAIGQWRHLTESEMVEINQAITDSSKTEESSFDANKQAVNKKVLHKKKSNDGRHKGKSSHSDHNRKPKRTDNKSKPNSSTRRDDKGRTDAFGRPIQRRLR